MNYDKMSLIAFLPFRSTPFIMSLSYSTGKGDDSPIVLFPFKVIFYNLLPVIYDKKFLNRIIKEVVSLITTSSQKDRLPNGPHISKLRASTHLNSAD